MVARLTIVAVLAACLTTLLLVSNGIELVSGEQIPLSSILPKLQAIHEDAQNLLIKNSELKAKILAGLQVQTEARLKEVKEMKMTGGPSGQRLPPGSGSQPPGAGLAAKPLVQHPSQEIDYAELEEFNKWVDSNLDYAVKNTQASAEALKEEAQQNNGNVDYSDQAIKDGIEGVKYWQSAVIFQDKTLNHEKFDPDFGTGNLPKPN